MESGKSNYRANPHLEDSRGIALWINDLVGASGGRDVPPPLQRARTPP
jgi:hypothetical protein